jgi:hypothetical protein
MGKRKWLSRYRSETSLLGRLYLSANLLRSELFLAALLADDIDRIFRLEACSSLNFQTITNYLSILKRVVAVHIL